MNIKFSTPWPFVALATLLSLPATGSAQILLSAGNFALLGGTAVSNSGTTIINGNIGANTAGGVTGFPPGTATGTIYEDDTTTSQGGLDLITAANGLSAMASTATETGTDLGGLTLLPGVYTFANAAALDGTLTLNANNEANAVWVFQIGTALTTSLNSAVILENAPGGGSTTGIYWDAKAAITIGAASTVLGNYLAGTSITFDGGDSALGGRLLAQAGVSISAASTLNSTGDPGGDGYDHGLMYNGSGQVVPLITVPEPAEFLWLAPLGAMGLAFWRRRSVANKLVA
jgi:type VI secretion system secreted protein VgrG